MYLQKKSVFAHNKIFWYFRSPDSSILTVLSGSPFLAALSWQSCSANLALHVQFCLSYSACPYLPVLICLSLSACPYLPVLIFLSLSACPFLLIM
jgi:hypothetical protein